MSARLRLRSAAIRRRSVPCRYATHAALIAVALLAQGCAAIPPQPFADAAASDPDVRVPPVGYRPVLSGYVSQRPVAPAAWRQQNERVAPRPKSDQ